MNCSLPSFSRIYPVLILLFLCTQSQGQIHYVHLNAAVTADGSNWTNAYIYPQQAIAVAAKSDSIFGAEGPYFPSLRHQGDSVRHSTFYIGKAIFNL